MIAADFFVTQVLIVLVVLDRVCRVRAGYRQNHRTRSHEILDEAGAPVVVFDHV